MKVSIIVPVYNVEKYIERCFDSIVSQVYDDIECIFVDDESPDFSFNILSDRISKYSGDIDFKIIRHDKNKGLSGARNSGTRIASGEYVYYLDSDDELYPDCIEELVSLARKYPGVEIVQGNTKTIPVPEKKMDWRNIEYKNYPEYVDDSYWIRKHFFAHPRIPVNAWNKLIKKEFIFKNNLFFKEGIIHEDEQWMFFVSKKIKNFAFTRKYCCIHYIVQGSIMQSGCNFKSIQSNYINVNEFIFNIDNDISRYQRKYILGFIKGDMLRIDENSRERELLNEYRKIAKVLFVKMIKNLKFIDCLFLSFFFFPKFIYKSFLGRKSTGLLLRLVY
jgi:glycosyltransferase involved in cell wall biosynthesis